MYINMHFLLDSKCLSTEPTENFQITYDKMWINNELIISLLNYGNNLPKHSHYSSSLIPYNNMPVAGPLIGLFSLGPRNRSEPSFHSLHCISKTASPNNGWWRKTSNLSCRYTELISEHINESHKYIPIYQEALIPAVLWLLLYVFSKDCLVKMLTYTGLPSTYVQQHRVTIVLGTNKFLPVLLEMYKTMTVDARTLSWPHFLAHFALKSQSFALAKAYPSMTALNSGHRNWEVLLEFDLN